MLLRRNPLSKSFVLTPFADYVYGAPAKVEISGTNAGFKIGYDVLRFGLAASWR